MCATPKPSVEKCEHEYELNKNGLKVCIKCGSCPALPKNWGKVKMPSGELVDFSAKRKKHEFECDECGIIHGHSAMCTKRSDTITIDRKLAQEVLDILCPYMTCDLVYRPPEMGLRMAADAIERKNRIISDFRLALSKEE